MKLASFALASLLAVGCSVGTTSPDGDSSSAAVSSSELGGRVVTASTSPLYDKLSSVTAVIPIDTNDDGAMTLIALGDELYLSASHVGQSGIFDLQMSATGVTGATLDSAGNVVIGSGASSATVTALITHDGVERTGAISRNGASTPITMEPGGDIDALSDVLDARTFTTSHGIVRVFDTKDLILVELNGKTYDLGLTGEVFVDATSLDDTSFQLTTDANAYTVSFAHGVVITPAK